MSLLLALDDTDVHVQTTLPLEALTWFVLVGFVRFTAEALRSASLSAEALDKPAGVSDALTEAAGSGDRIQDRAAVTGERLNKGTAGDEDLDS